MYFYEILQRIMNQRNLKVADVARLCNLSDSTVRSIFSRKQKSVALDVAFKLSDGLNISLKELNGNIDSAPTGNREIKNDTPDIILNSHEKKLIISYREHPELQPAINKMLDVQAKQTNSIGEDIANELKQKTLIPTNTK